MVKIIWLLTFMLGVACSGAAVGEVRLTVRADKKTVTLGEPLSVELKAEDVREPLSSVNLQRLKRDFNVFGISSSVQMLTKKGRRISVETMTLTLYPLRTGKLQLPALSYRGKSSAPLQLSVLESGKQTPRVVFKTAIDTLQPQVRQASTLTLDIYDDGSLQWTAPRELTVAGAHQRRLAESQREELVEGLRYTIHHYAWALTPLREGGMSVVFPMLDAFKFGTRLRYAVPPLWLDARPVPAYLPVHVPIGKPFVTPEPLPHEIALGRPLNRTFTVQAAGVSEEGIIKLLSAIRSNESLRFYPPMIEHADNGRPGTATQTFLVTLPFVPLRTGTLQWPEINLPYYDPASSRVESILIPGELITVFHPVWKTVQYTALGLVLLLFLLSLGYYLFKQVRRVRARQKALLAIVSATSANELYRALLSFDCGTAALQCQTLQQWLQHMQTLYGVDKRLDAVVQTLERARYGATQTNTEVTVLSSEAGKVLRQCTRGNKRRRKEERKSGLLNFRPPESAA